MMKDDYDRISLLFKENNKELYEWILKRSKEEDMSISSFVVHSLKKIRKMENENGEKNSNQ